MSDIAPGSAAQGRNKVWIRGGVVRHFARLLGYLLLIPVQLVILLISAVIYAAAWTVHHIGFPGRLRKLSWEPAIVVLLSLIVFLFMTLYGPFPPGGTATEKMVVVKRGMGVREIAALLASEEIIPSANQFLLLSRLLGLEGRLQAGKYVLETGSRPREVIRRLSRGGVVSQMVTLPEGLSIRQMADLLREKSGVDAELFLTLANDAETARQYGIAAGTLEGYLFPDTYDLYWGMPAGEVIEVMVGRFLQVYDADDAQSQIFENETAIPNIGPFSGTTLHGDDTDGEAGRFSSAPGGHVAYSNWAESRIWGGDQMGVAGFLVVRDPAESPADFWEKVFTNDTATYATLSGATQIYIGSNRRILSLIHI